MAEFHLYLYGPSRGPLNSSFEEAEARLRELPRLHFEPDGSFVWVVEPGRHTVYGMVYDAAGRIQYCDLRGWCDPGAWRVLCAALAGETAGPLEVLQLPGRKLQTLQSFEASLLQN
jgi:hypothetical protein